MTTLANGVTGSAIPRFQSPQAIELDDIPNKSIAGLKQHWGYELILDCSGCNKRIDDEQAVRAFLTDLVAGLQMKVLGPPQIFKVDGPEGRGLTALQGITTSSITFHGDNQRWCVYLNVFSCKPYAPKIVLDKMEQHFSPKHMGKPLWLHRDAGRWPER